MGGEPDLQGKRVLEIGCGYGELSLYIARAGAAKIIGLDLDAERIDVANQQLKDCVDSNGTENKVEFYCCDPRDLPSSAMFDVVVSRDTLEHIQNVEGVVDDIVRRLPPCGRLYIGAGPLYRSPYGGHGRMHMWIPWGHLILPDRFVLYWANRYRREEKKAKSIMELGLNKISVVECARIFNREDLISIRWMINHGDNFISRVFKKLSKVNFVREYFAHDIYTVLEKTTNYGITVKNKND